MLASVGLVVFVFESFLPILPWFRPGLGNVATLLALMLFGFRDAVTVTVLRIVLGALVLGRLFTPVFLFAFGGGIASVLVMTVVLKLPGRLFGPVGASMAGAVAHNTAQLAIACVFVGSANLFMLFPLFMATGVATGAAVGLVAAIVCDAVGHRFS